MSLPFIDRVKETCTSPGVGAVTLLGAVSGFSTFSSAFPTGTLNKFSYAIVDQSGSNWEVGKASLITSTLMVRLTIEASSNAGSLVNFSTGTQNVFATFTAKDINQLATFGINYCQSIGCGSIF